MSSSMRRFLTSGLIVVLLVIFRYAQSPLPVVDLGYERHQAIRFDKSTHTYNFSNVRYAEAPIGDLRFRAPKPPRETNPKVDDGSRGRICPQANPAWLMPQFKFLNAYLTGQAYDVSELRHERNESVGQVLPRDPRETEDCLFLDVIVPDAVFKRKRLHGKGAPVLVWIHGGGFASGEKTGNGQFDPTGLYQRASALGEAKFIFVSLNYRLGALGWAAGPMIEKEGVINAGLYDQRLALDWVQRNIHLFGGDQHAVTIMGESAGGASIMHQITAFGGENGPVPFKRAIPQSPAWYPLPKREVSKERFEVFLGQLNISSVTEARNVTSEQIIQANTRTILAADWGNFVFGPTVDKHFAPELPGKLLLQGRFDKAVEVMVGHNSEEALLLTPPYISNTAAFENYVGVAFKGIQAPARDYIERMLYSTNFDGQNGYTNDFTRAKLMISDSGFTCNAYYLHRAFNNRTYAYKFAVPPAIHGMDLDYTFYRGPPSSVIQPKVAEAMQGYIVGLVTMGKPGVIEQGVPELPMYGSTSLEVVLSNEDSMTLEKDENNSEKCRWWQEAHYAD